MFSPADFPLCENLDDLRILGRILASVPLTPQHPDPAVLGSPARRRIDDAVFAALTAADVETRGQAKADEWAEWRAADRRPTLLSAVRDRIRLTRNWNGIPKESRAEFVLNLLSPFRPSPGLLGELVEWGNAAHA